MSTAKARLPIACSKYEPGADGRRCRHYVGNGACGLPDEFMCVEWLKVNGHPLPKSEPPPLEPPPLERNLLGGPMILAPARAPEPPPRVPGRQRPTHVSVPLRDEVVASFKALGVEVRLAVEGGDEVWLVPGYTGQDRAELTYEHALLLAAASSAFPGASVKSFVRRKAK